jgi:hypothetical protein
MAAPGLSLRDLLMGNIPGNALNMIPLGDAQDPQFNKFTYNIFGQLGPSPGVKTGQPTIFGGPFGVGPEQQQAPQRQQGPQAGTPGNMQQYAGFKPNVNFGMQMGGAPQSNIPSYMGQTPLQQPKPGYFGETFNNQSFSPYGQTRTPYTQDLPFGAGGGQGGLMNRMLAWKG